MTRNVFLLSCPCGLHIKQHTIQQTSHQSSLKTNMSDSKTYSTTSIIWFTSKWFLWAGVVPKLSPPSIPRLRCPWARHRTPNSSTGAAAYVCVCVCVCACVCVCSLLCVCTLDGLNAEHKFRVWVTILGHMSCHFVKPPYWYRVRCWGAVRIRQSDNLAGGRKWAQHRFHLVNQNTVWSDSWMNDSSWAGSF